MSAIFISYRRSDSAHFTGRICARLQTELGADQVFMDTASIPPGADFPSVLDERLQRCRVALVIIGCEWVSVQEPDGTRRLDNPNDFVRIEVETALQRGIPVIPVLIGGAGHLLARDLPTALHALARRNTTKVQDDPRFDEDMAALVRNIQQLLGPPPGPAPSTAGARDSPVGPVPAQALRHPAPDRSSTGRPTSGAISPGPKSRTGSRGGICGWS
jgi:hypothetical protein